MSFSFVRCTATVRHGAYLPHWTIQGAIYSVCFRLADSLPQAKLDAWRRERDALLAEAGPSAPMATQESLREPHSDKVEAFLDTGSGHCWLERADVVDIVKSALCHFQGRRYDLLAWCIMPNHVHAVLRPFACHALPGILKTWKGFSARQANRILGLRGAFWQPESYDHLVRDDVDLANAIRYVRDNPLKAGLVDWAWVWEKPTGFQIS